jgi:hypothetical protein
LGKPALAGGYYTKQGVIEMKKLLMLAVACVLCMPLFAQERDKGSDSAAPSAEITAMQTAYNLAKYGYSAYSASALIGAAEILAKIQTQPLSASPSMGQGTAAGETRTEAPPEFTPANLLADARKFAGNDSTMIAWADSVQRQLGAATRGAAGGPKQALERVPAFNTVTYTINFQAGQLAQVYVSGDGYTDLDLYVYDQNGSLVAYDEDYTDECLVRWIPSRTGTFTIVVKNLGRVWNQYYLLTN